MAVATGQDPDRCRLHRQHPSPAVADGEAGRDRRPPLGRAPRVRHRCGLRGGRAPHVRHRPRASSRAARRVARVPEAPLDGGPRRFRRPLLPAFAMRSRIPSPCRNHIRRSGWGPAETGCCAWSRNTPTSGTARSTASGGMSDSRAMEQYDAAVEKVNGYCAEIGRDPGTIARLAADPLERDRLGTAPRKLRQVARGRLRRADHLPGFAAARSAGGSRARPRRRQSCCPSYASSGRPLPSAGQAAAASVAAMKAQVMLRVFAVPLW